MNNLSLIVIIFYGKETCFVHQLHNNNLLLICRPRYGASNNLIVPSFYFIVQLLTLETVSFVLLLPLHSLSNPTLPLPKIPYTLLTTTTTTPLETQPNNHHHFLLHNIITHIFNHLTPQKTKQLTRLVSHHLRKTQKTTSLHLWIY